MAHLYQLMYIIRKSCCSCETKEDQALNTGCRTGVNWRREGWREEAWEGVRFEGREEEWEGKRVVGGKKSGREGT